MAPAGIASLNHALDRAAGTRPIPGNRVELLLDGPATYGAMLQIIEEANRRIHFENYIFRSDRAGWRFAEALAARARQGIEVRLIYDWLGSYATRRKLWRYLRDAGVQLYAFNRPRLIDAFANLSRDHRKLVVADGRVAVTGGLCIGDEWVGDETRGVLPWRDTAVRITGPAATALDRTFGYLWERMSNQALPEPSDVPSAGNAAIRVIAGRPGRERAYKVLEILAASSATRLWITDAYLVPPPRLFQAFLDAARAGLDIRLLVPGSSDLPLVRNLTRVGYRQLLRAGVRIYEWEGPMLHAKSGVADGHWTRVGTSNLNASSLLGNYELDVLTDDPGFAQAMEEQFRRDIARSLEVVRGPRRIPARLQRMMPARLARQAPDERPLQHFRSRREGRRRAVVALWTVITGARRSIYGPAAVILIVLAGLFLLLPRAMAYAVGAICTWLAVAAFREATRRRQE